MTAFAVVPLGSLGAAAFIEDHATRTAVVGSGVVIGLTSFVVGLVMDHTAAEELREAVCLYNR